jgi:transcriptional regulator
MKKNFSVERLPCIMTKDEKLEDAERLASTLRQIRTIETAQEEVVKNYKNSLKRYEDEMNNLSEELRTGEKFKDIKVEAKVNEKLIKMEFFRTDTMEMIRTRDLTDEERQLVMPVVDKMKKGKEEKTAPADIAAAPDLGPSEEEFPPETEESEK